MMGNPSVETDAPLLVHDSQTRFWPVSATSSDVAGVTHPSDPSPGLHLRLSSPSMSVRILSSVSLESAGRVQTRSASGRRVMTMRRAGPGKAVIKFWALSVAQPCSSTESRAVAEYVGHMFGRQSSQTFESKRRAFAISAQELSLLDAERARYFRGRPCSAKPQAKSSLLTPVHCFDTTFFARSSPNAELRAAFHQASNRAKIPWCAKHAYELNPGGGREIESATRIPRGPNGTILTTTSNAALPEKENAGAAKNSDASPRPSAQQTASRNRSGTARLLPTRTHTCWLDRFRPPS
ncbi:hypothetical protein DFJ73DRAFT_852357 [Zopfochytrium polystomum]|nr:hypothetical protein DFJ73DRAFT_852357 [Zopfochytrium polystomum]